MRRFRSRAFAAVALATLAAGCLFETTPPQRTSSQDEPPPDPTAVVITGLVQVFDRMDHDVTPGGNWGVQFTWYQRDRDHDGQLDVLTYSNTVSDNDGVYRVSLISPDVIAVDIAARKCPEESEPAPCCLDHQNPCGGPQCEVWLPPRRAPAVPGQRLHENLTVRCDFVP